MSESVKQSGNGGGKKGSKGKSMNAGKDQGKGKKQGGKSPAKPVAGKRGSNVASLEDEVEKELRKAQGGSSEATDEATEADPDDENFDEPDEEVYDGMGSVFFPVDQVYALILAVTSNAGLKNQSYMSYRRLFDNTPIATFAIGMRIFSDPPDTELEAIIRDFQHGLLHGREIVYTTNVIAKTLTNGIKGRITLEVTEAQKQGIRGYLGRIPKDQKPRLVTFFFYYWGHCLTVLL